MTKTGAPYKRTRNAKKQSQNRKPMTGGSDNVTPLQRHEIEQMLNELHTSHSWRWIARYSVGLSHYGWLQRIASGKRDVKPKKITLLMVRRLYDELQHRADSDGERLKLSLKMMYLLGEMNVTVSRILDLNEVRK